MDPGSLLLIVATFGLLFLFTSRGRRQQREVQRVQSELRPGARVMTSSGLYATVVALEEDGAVLLETGPGQHSRWDRRAVARLLTPAVGEVDDEDDEDDDEVEDDARVEGAEAHDAGEVRDVPAVREEPRPGDASARPSGATAVGDTNGMPPTDRA